MLLLVFTTFLSTQLKIVSIGEVLLFFFQVRLDLLYTILTNIKFIFYTFILILIL